MKKFFCTLMILALMILPDTGNASELQPYKTDGEYHIVYPTINPDIKNSQLPVYAKVGMKINETVHDFWDSTRMNDFVYSTLNYEIMCDKNNLLSIVFTATMRAENGIYDKDAEGNHIPFTYKQTLNFDMRTGDFIEPENLKDISGKYNYTPKDITNKLKSYAKAHNVKLSDDFQEFQIIPQRYYIDENLHLHFIFAAYEVASSLHYSEFIDIDMTK